ncbi:MAG: OmpA family protein [Acidobacteriota bacterium]|nr:OmpA family protein [Acidobacteriota bacterium]
MSDSKKNPKIPPPDDFSKTTPNIDFEEENSDWAAPSSDSPAETPADDWGKTVINYNVSEEHQEPRSFGEEQHPSADSPKQPDWGMTQQNVTIDDEFADAEPSGDENYGATTPYFRLPEPDREKYLNLPPTPSEQAAKEEAEEKKGVPVWFWAAAAIMTMLTISFVAFLGIWYFFLAEKGFEVTIRGAKPGSTFRVNGTLWGVEDEGRAFKLRGLKAGKRQIEIVNPNSICSNNPFTIEGREGDSLEEVVSCKDRVVSTLDCANTRNVQERAQCAEMALDALGDPPDLDALLKALNMLIINFASGKADIPPDKMAILKKASVKIQQLPETVVIEVGGHTDNVGSDSNNLALSDRRASAVKKALLDFGVRDASLTTKGYGESSPKADNNTEQGRFDNRRIEYKAVQR